MRLSVFILLLVSHISMAQNYGGDSWATVNSKGSGKLAVVYYPQAGLISEEGGKMKGLCVDLLDDFVAYVQAKHHKKITIDYQGEEKVFSEFLKVTQTTPNVLGVTYVTVTEERKKVMKFTPPFLSNQETLITHKDAPAVDHLKNIGTILKGYSIKIIAGSVHQKYAEQIKRENMPQLAISTGPSGTEILKEISTNPKLFTILDFTEYVDAVRKQIPVKRQNVQIGPIQDLAFCMSKQSDWDEIWNEFLTPEYRKSEKYRKFIASNLGGAYLSVFK
ncbi:MAG: transporter substrate-binding domain-containing protein [Bacteroidetes bacterium]|nr:transporter substrate-binding domain-containing protein [Bacteroidota bacterium]MBS1539968.1 transporter substrate-binding domain-containing protein [Bacteroidota bacterium]